MCLLYRFKQNGLRQRLKNDSKILDGADFIRSRRLRSDDFLRFYNIYSKESGSFHFAYGHRSSESGISNQELYEAKAGYLILCDGDIIDYQQIVNDILARAKYLQIMELAMILINRLNL